MINRQKLKELRQRYGFDLAVVRQKGTQLDEQAEYESLLLHEMNLLIHDAVNEFAGYLDDEEAAASLAFAVLMSHAGQLAHALETTERGKRGLDIGFKAFDDKYKGDPDDEQQG